MWWERGDQEAVCLGEGRSGSGLGWERGAIWLGEGSCEQFGFGEEQFGWERGDQEAVWLGDWGAIWVGERSNLSGRGEIRKQFGWETGE